MKDSEFLELLNLYLDHEITAAEAARLEAEVQNNAERRALYREYCRMQKACRILATDLQVDGSGAMHAVGGGKVIAFDLHPARRAHRVGLYLAASAAMAAAGVGFIFVNAPKHAAEIDVSRNPRPLAESSGRQATPIANNLFVAAEDSGPRGLVAAAAIQPGNTSPKVSLVVESLILSGGRQVETAQAVTVPPADDQLAWMRSFQLVSLQERKQLAEFRFEVAPPILRPEASPLGGRGPADATVELTAFRFIK